MDSVTSENLQDFLRSGSVFEEHDALRLSAEPETAVSNSTVAPVVTSGSTSPSAENAANEARLRRYRKEMTAQLLNIVTEGDFEYGFRSALDRFLDARFSENALVTRQWLNELFVEHWKKPTIASGILRAIAHIDYEKMSPNGIAMAVAAFSHADIEVRECGIRALESWANSECLGFLKHVQCQDRWLSSYIQRVIQDIEQELIGDASSGAEDRPG